MRCRFLGASVGLGLAIVVSAAAQTPDQLMARCLGNDNSPPEQSLQACTAVLKLGASAPQAPAQTYYDRARVHETMKRLDLALADIDQALKLAPAEATILFWQARLYQDLGKDDLALAGYAEALRADPGLDECLSRRGQIYLKAGALDLADREFAALATRATIEAPTAALLSRGIAQLKLGKSDAALPAFALALKSEPRSPWEEATALYGSGLAHRAKGEASAGDAAIARATALDQDVSRRFEKFGLKAG